MKLVFLTLAACLFTLISKMGHSVRPPLKQVSETTATQKSIK